MAQPKTARITVPTSSSSVRTSGGTAVAVRPTITKGPAPTHDQISKRAHDLWLKKGCKHGQDEQNWLEAEAQLRAEMARK
jgi:hypothetical protein